MATPKLAPLDLSAEERQVLAGWERRRTTAQALALRSRIVLACADGRSNTEVAAALGVSRPMVVKWRVAFPAGPAGRAVGRATTGCPAEDHR